MDDNNVRHGATERAKDASLPELARKVLGSHALGPSNLKKKQVTNVFQNSFFSNNKL